MSERIALWLFGILFMGSGCVMAGVGAYFETRNQPGFVALTIFIWIAIWTIPCVTAGFLEARRRRANGELSEFPETNEGM